MKICNGQILHGTPISVDYWQWTPGERYCRFLTHLHADHTCNLKSTFCEKIYTSPFNGWLLRKWFDIDPELIEALEVGDPHVITDVNDRPFSVTLIDANHCPGSVMFLFQGYFGNILYTGDFRYNADILEQPLLKSVIENEVVHRLYLDNTFAAEHCEFPPREEALKKVIELIRNHPGHNILIGVRKLGKEEVLKAIALEFKEEVCVSKDRLDILKYLEYPAVFTIDPGKSRIHVKEMNRISTSYILDLQTSRGPVLTILLTALYSVLPRDEHFTTFMKDKCKSVEYVPYSDHSSHSEIVEFVSKVKPHVIYPVVQNSTVSKHSNNDFQYPITSTVANSVIPQSILLLSKYPEGNKENVNEMLNSKDQKGSLSQYVLYQLTEDESRTSFETLDGAKKREKEKLNKDLKLQISEIQKNDTPKEPNACKNDVSYTKTSKGSEDEYFSCSDFDFIQENAVLVPSILSTEDNLQKTGKKYEKCIFCKSGVQLQDLNMCHKCLTLENCAPISKDVQQAGNEPINLQSSSGSEDQKNSTINKNPKINLKEKEINASLIATKENVSSNFDADSKQKELNSEMILPTSSCKTLFDRDDCFLSTSEEVDPFFPVETQKIDCSKNVEKKSNAFSAVLNSPKPSTKNYSVSNNTETLNSDVQETLVGSSKLSKDLNKTGSKDVKNDIGLNAKTNLKVKKHVTFGTPPLCTDSDKGKLFYSTPINKHPQYIDSTKKINDTNNLHDKIKKTNDIPQILKTKHVAKHKLTNEKSYSPVDMNLNQSGCNKYCKTKVSKIFKTEAQNTSKTQHANCRICSIFSSLRQSRVQSADVLKKLICSCETDFWKSVNKNTLSPELETLEFYHKLDTIHKSWKINSTQAISNPTKVSSINSVDNGSSKVNPELKMFSLNNDFNTNFKGLHRKMNSGKSLCHRFCHSSRYSPLKKCNKQKEISSVSKSNNTNLLNNCNNIHENSKKPTRSTSIYCYNCNRTQNWEEIFSRAKKV